MKINIDMENKIIELVREFNAGLENSNEYNNLRYINDGFQNVIVIPEIYLWTDESSSEYVRENTLSSLVKQLSDLLEIASPMLTDEIDKFFGRKRIEMQEKFTNAKLKYQRISAVRWQAYTTGKYNEDCMEQFMKVLREDFKYLFNSTLEIEY